MDRKELVDRYFLAWNEANLSDLLRLLHPQASYYDAFWGETCSGGDLAKYLGANLELELRWYKQDNDIVGTPNGMAVRYSVFDNDDTLGLNPLFNGAEIFTVSSDVIMTVSDYYCDPSTADLIAVAALAEGQHGRADAVQRGLGAKSSNRIERRLAELAREFTLFLDPELTVTKLATAVDCTVMHLFHVLEERKQTSFLEFVNECRARYASTLLVETPRAEVRFDNIAEQSGFESIEDFRRAFQTTFDVNPDEYMERFATPQSH